MKSILYILEPLGLLHNIRNVVLLIIQSTVNGVVTDCSYALAEFLVSCFSCPILES